MRWLVVVLLVFFGTCAFAEERSYDFGEIIVTPDRFEESVEETGTSTSVVDEQYIHEKSNIEVSSVLKALPGISTAQNGGLGAFTAVYIRGAESYHTLVMIDGVEMNDPISPGRSFDFGNLLTDDIAKIEVVRGPQSTLYGSDAMGGVINIITKKGTGKPVVGAFFEGGSYYTYRESAYSGGAFGKGDYSVNLSHIESDGFSSAAGGSEKDGYKNTTFNGNIGVDLFQKLKWDTYLRYFEAWSALDNGSFDDDPDFDQDTVSFSGRTGIEHTVKDWWKYDLYFSWLNIHRDDRNVPDELHPFDDSKDWFDGQDYKVDWQNTFEICDFSTLIGGVEYKDEVGKSFSKMVSSFGEFITEFPKKSVDTLGAYVQDTLKLWERLLVTFGGRYEDHQIFGANTDYKIWANYRVPKIDTKLKGSIGTGFKAPSLFQLYSIYGSTDLRPEEVKSFDIGFEQPLFGERLIAGVTYFHNNFSDLIDWNDALWKYQNISKAITQGFETEVSWLVISDLKAGFTYTYLQTEDKTTGMELDRRPMHTYGFVVSWYPTEKITARMDALMVGDRKDVDYSKFPYEQITLDSYVKLDLSLHYKFNPHCEVFGRVENLLDEKYQEVYGFNSPMISGYGGMKVEF